MSYGVLILNVLFIFFFQVLLTSIDEAAPAEFVNCARIFNINYNPVSLHIFCVDGTSEEYFSSTLQTFFSDEFTFCVA